MACNCPDGYILQPDGITCERVITIDATFPEDPIKIDITFEGGINPGFYGFVLYEDITSNQAGGTKQWPLILTPQNPPIPDGNYSLSTNSIIPAAGPNWTSISPAPTGPNGEHDWVNTVYPAGWPLPPLPNPIPPYNDPNAFKCLRESVVTSNVLFYGTGAPILPEQYFDIAPWRRGEWANSVGIWPNGFVSNQKWVGLSTCFFAPEAKTYYILFTVNNAFRFKIDGELAVEFNSGDGLQTPLGFVNAFPITLTAGYHIFYGEAFNYSGGGQFSLDILDITEAQLLAITTLPQIDPYRVFSSLWKRPRPITITATGTTTITSAGLFSANDVGAVVDVTGAPLNTTISQFIDANTVVLSQPIPAGVQTGELYFIWETGTSSTNAWSCPINYDFVNCGTPSCILTQTAECVPEPCYLLVECDNKLPSIITSTDLSVYVGKVIKIATCPNNCWQVFETLNCEDTIIIVPTYSFDTCLECNPPIVVPIPEVLHARKIKPGYDTPGCSPEYTERINCKFADQVYNRIIQRRYGVTACCEDEYDKYLLKKEILDLRAIYADDVCLSTCITCKPPCGVEAVMRIYNPITCDAPEDVEAVISFIIGPCDDPTNVIASAVIIFN